MCGQRAKAKTGETYPKNCAPAGPISTSLLANPSPSTMGGGLASLCLFTRRHVMRVGAVHLRGGMMIRIPWWRLPRMEPPLASTIKLTRNLWRGKDQSVSRTEVKVCRELEIQRQDTGRGRCHALPETTVGSYYCGVRSGMHGTHTRGKGGFRWKEAPAQEAGKSAEAHREETVTFFKMELTVSMKGIQM